jgi:hypothetical protein
MYWGSPRTSISQAERLEQTGKTVASLVQAGVTEIFLADNSGEQWVAGTEESLRPAKVYVYNHFQFQNKGISELYLLLSVLAHVPPETPILKISGRYYLKNGLDGELEDSDVAAKFIEYRKSKFMMSTRCYMVKNREVYEKFLRGTLRELYGYSARIVGPGSLLRIFRNSLFPKRDEMPYDDPVDPIEVAAARALKKYNFKVRSLERLGIEGMSGDAARRLIVE